MWSTLKERNAKAKPRYVRSNYQDGHCTHGRHGHWEYSGTQLGLRSEWWGAVGRIAREYDLDGVYYMLQYRRMSPKGNWLARIPDGWMQDLGKGRVSAIVKKKELEQWKQGLKYSERSRVYAESRSNMKMEPYIYADVI